MRVFRHSHFIIALLLSACVETASMPAPVTHLGTRLDSPAGAVMVEQGDTLWRISQRYRLPLRDIIDMNGLQPPYALSQGQRLRLPAPVEHKVGKDDTLYRLSRMYQVPVSQLVKTNRLSSPYHLKIGQKLRIPSRGVRLEPYPNVTTVAASAGPVRKSDAIEAVYLGSPRQQAAATPVRSEPVGQYPAAIPVATTMVLGSQRPDFSWPLRGKVVSSYGPKEGGLYNDGINIAAPKGAPVGAAADGIVAYVGRDLGSYGNLVLVRHSGGMVTAYAHLATVRVTKGSAVRKGQAIGTVGSTGTVANSQLHFEIRKGTDTLDPKKFLG